MNVRKKRILLVIILAVAIILAIVAINKIDIPRIAFPSDVPIEELSTMDAKALIIDGEYDYLVVKKGDMDDEYITSFINALDCIYCRTLFGNQIYKVRNNNYESLAAGKLSEEETDKEVDRIIEDTGIEIRDISISLSGDDNSDAKELNQFIVLNDQHSILTYGEAMEENYETIDTRYNQMFLTRTGVHAEDCWQNISAIADCFNADGILMAGDMVDFKSKANYHFFKKGLDKIKTPILYARADHDKGLWYQDTNESDAEDLGIDDEDVMSWDMGEYYIMAWNNSTSQLTEEGLVKANEVFKSGKPVILLTHVPLCPDKDVDTGLAEAAAEFDQEGRLKLWGKDCLYQPNETTQSFLDEIYKDDTPVVAVISGHLHFEYTGQLTENVMQYVLAPTFEGNMTRLTVTE